MHYTLPRMKATFPSSVPLVGAFVLGAVLGWWGGVRSGIQSSAQANGAKPPESGAETPLRTPRTVPPANRGGKVATLSDRGKASLVGLDLREMRRRLDAMTDSAARQQAIREVLATMPVTAWQEWLLDLGNADRRSPSKGDIPGMARRYNFANDVFGAVASLDPAGFMATLNSEGQRNNDGESEGRMFVVMKWMEVAPDAAKAFLTKELASGKPAPGLADSARYAAAVLSRMEDPSTLDWAATLPEEQRGQVISATLRELAQNDPAEAASKFSGSIDRIGPDSSRVSASRLAGEIANEWARTDPAAALAWATGLPGDSQKKAVENAMSGWAEKDVDAALTALSTLPPSVHAAALPALISKAPPARIADLATRLEGLPVSPGRIEASERLMDRWSGQNPEEASAWMGRQPEGDVRDAAISRFIRWADVREPDAALLWAGSMSDPRKRLETILHVVQQLGQKAPQFVTPWLEKETRLSTEDRSNVLSRLPRQ